MSGLPRSPRVPALVVAGVSSGVGKTTVTLGLLEALGRRGLTVQAFKVGPDFIDPAFHAVATGRPSYTLDGWMCGREHARATVGRRAADADLALVEGMMGCFDGVEGQSEEGSTAQIAKWLGAPVILAVDAGAMARSAAAVALGFERFDADLELGGVIFNRAGGPTHRRWLAEATGQACKTRVLGALPAETGVALPERHLGLVTVAEGGYTPLLRRRLADLIEEHVDLETLLGTARSEVEREPVSPVTPTGARVILAVARDKAFQFYYPENLERLRDAGATLRFWSPLHDQALPEADGLYLGGGYPELHAGALSANVAMRRQVRAFAESGRPVYAECGGLMYLAEALATADRRVWPMVGVLPAQVSMEPARLAIGYRDLEMARGGLLGPAGTRARGHEFHCSRLGPVPPSVPRIYAVTDACGSETRVEGYSIGGTVASYVHLHFGSNPALAVHFVRACARPC